MQRRKVNEKRSGVVRARSARTTPPTTGVRSPRLNRLSLASLGPRVRLPARESPSGRNAPGNRQAPADEQGGPEYWLVPAEILHFLYGEDARHAARSEDDRCACVVSDPREDRVPFASRVSPTSCCTEHCVHRQPDEIDCRRRSDQGDGTEDRRDEKDAVEGGVDHSASGKSSDDSGHHPSVDRKTGPFGGDSSFSTTGRSGSVSLGSQSVHCLRRGRIQRAPGRASRVSRGAGALRAHGVPYLSSWAGSGQS